MFKLSVFLAVVFAFEFAFLGSALPGVAFADDFAACGADIGENSFLENLLFLSPIGFIINQFTSDDNNTLVTCALAMLKAPVSMLILIGNLLTFNVEGAPGFVRFIIGTPLTVAFAFLVGPTLIQVVRAIGSVIPFT